MKNKIFIYSGLVAVLLSGCAGKGAEEKTANEELKGNIYISERDEKSEIKFEGEEALAGASLYTGNGYSIYIPDEGFRKGMDFDEGILEDYWESTVNDEVEIHVASYGNVSPEKAQEHFLKENDDYVFEDLTGKYISGKEKDGDTLWFFTETNEGNTYIVSWEYPKAAEEAFSAKLAKIAETFQVENK